jgi:galactokinase
MNLKELTAHVTAECHKRYGQLPRWIVAAPGRVNIIGEHTDYNDGFVLPMAIERYAIMAADTAIVPGKTTIYDTQFKETVTIDISVPISKGQPKWSNYIRGVFAGFQNRGVRIPALNVAFLSTVPLGGGLSSSAALEVCTATLLELVTGVKIDPVEKALLCQKAEHEFAGVPCGIMDQFVSVMGQKDHLLLLDCSSHETQFVPMNDPSVALLVINTNVKHELSGGEYAERRVQCETAAKILGVPSLRNTTHDALIGARSKMDRLVYRRARHVTSEIERTLQTAQAIQNSDWLAVGRHMYDSHCSLRDDFEVSCKELDAVVDICESIATNGGVYGCRMTGGGFGGSCIALVKVEAMQSITKQISTYYKIATMRDAASSGLEPMMFSSRPAAGAMVIMG